MRLLAAWSLAPLVAAAGQANAPELPATTVTLYKVSQGPDECGQFTIDARLKEAAEKWLQMAEGHCGAHGYEEPTGSRSAVVPIIGGHVNVTLYKKADPLAGLKKAGKGALSQALARAMGLPTERLPVCCKTCEEGRSKYYEINDEKRLCSEVCMTPQAALVARFFAPSLVEAESGAVCASLGYEIYNETVAKGPGVQADVYAWGAKPAEADEGWTTIYRSEGAECFQATAARRYADLAVAAAGFQEGRCADGGFTEEQDAQVPGLLTGEARLTLWKRPGELALGDMLRFTRSMFGEEGGGSATREPSLMDFLV
ncbi:unnamed protein product [Prorocentrum cordatum]|uniref:Uncharacterized protein n=1 Tax=Prorocentrum cordatum TaxID=2364126 RepID=A0ABN9VQ33_9DINO|nr:unnamed protein product [Polarella glacialis]|mmetsp:Transcript_102286/g.266986  ORF Transcript_102286/g.266986 Transcript_102286/m.266986 type:complete len:314 (+) Transcript_102286:88-1029(+)